MQQWELVTPTLLAPEGAGTVPTLAPSTLQLCPSLSFKSKGQRAGLGESIYHLEGRGGREEGGSVRRGS